MGKLTFKGDATMKKKKKKSSLHRSTSAQSAEQQHDQLDGWLTVPEQQLALGPIYITQPPTRISSQNTICVALQPTTNKIIPFTIQSASTSNSAAATAALLLNNDNDDLDLDQATIVEQDQQEQGPSDVHHVFVCTRVQDSSDKVTLRTATNKFLASDEIGTVSADREARGMQEEWTISPAASSSSSSSSSGSGSGFYTLKSSYGKYLSVDLVAGGKLELRADEDNEGETERWKIYMQGEYVSKARKALIQTTGVRAAVKAGHEGLTIVGDLGKAESEYISKYQGYGQGRVINSKEDVRDLKRAKKEGKLGEAMLERRMKLKSDRYC
ncbi:hypothetical protein T439DRAFT_338786 [Meredithblackwellia eburnea MCA 4105]